MGAADEGQAGQSGAQQAEVGSGAALGAIMMGAGLLQVASTVVATVVPLRLALAERPPVLIGTIASAFSVGFLLGCFVVPTLLRRVGHIRGFAVFATLQAIASISFLFLSDLGWALSRLVMGLSAAGYIICIESWISGQASGTQRGRIFGIYQIFMRIALIGSQLVLGYVSIQSETVFLVASVVFSLALIPVALTRASAPQIGEVVAVRFRKLWGLAPLATLAALYVGLVGGTLPNLAPAYGVLIGLDQRDAVLLTAALQIGALAFQWQASRLADRTTARFVLPVYLIVVTAAAAALILFVRLGWANGLVLPGLLFVVIGGFSIPLYTVAVAQAYRRVGREHAIGLSAQLSLLWAVGATIGPALASLAMQLLGAQGMLIYLIALSLCLLVTTALSPGPRAPIPDAR